MPHGAIPFPFGKCRICNDKATGIHYGVATCEGCKGFYKRSITKGVKYRCYFGGKCVITPENRNRCKSCRYHKCLTQGMAVEAVKMGRIPKVEKERALEEAAPPPTTAVTMPQDSSQCATAGTIQAANHPASFAFDRNAGHPPWDVAALKESVDKGPHYQRFVTEFPLNQGGVKVEAGDFPENDCQVAFDHHVMAMDQSSGAYNSKNNNIYMSNSAVHSLMDGSTMDSSCEQPPDTFSQPNENNSNMIYKAGPANRFSSQSQRSSSFASADGKRRALYRTNSGGVQSLDNNIFPKSCDNSSSMNVNDDTSSFSFQNDDTFCSRRKGASLAWYNKGVTVQTDTRSFISPSEEILDPFENGVWGPQANGNIDTECSSKIGIRGCTASVRDYSVDCQNKKTASEEKECHQEMDIEDVHLGPRAFERMANTSSGLPKVMPHMSGTSATLSKDRQGVENKPTQDNNKETSPENGSNSMNGDEMECNTYSPELMKTMFNQVTQDQNGQQQYDKLLQKIASSCSQEVVSSMPFTGSTSSVIPILASVTLTDTAPTSSAMPQNIYSLHSHMTSSHDFVAQEFNHKNKMKNANGVMFFPSECSPAMEGKPGKFPEPMHQPWGQTLGIPSCSQSQPFQRGEQGLHAQHCQQSQIHSLPQPSNTTLSSSVPQPFSLAQSLPHVQSQLDTHYSGNFGADPSTSQDTAQDFFIKECFPSTCSSATDLSSSLFKDNHQHTNPTPQTPSKRQGTDFPNSNSTLEDSPGMSVPSDTDCFNSVDLAPLDGLETDPCEVDFSSLCQEQLRDMQESDSVSSVSSIASTLEGSHVNFGPACFTDTKVKDIVSDENFINSGIMEGTRSSCFADQQMRKSLFPSTNSSSHVKKYSGSLSCYTEPQIKEAVDVLGSGIYDLFECDKKHAARDKFVKIKQEDPSAKVPPTVSHYTQIYNLLIENLPQLNEKIISFCQLAPGFTTLDPSDQKNLLKRAYYDIWMLTSSEYFVDGESYLMVTDDVFYIRRDMEIIIGAENTQTLHCFAQQFNALGLSHLEIAILCCIQLTAAGHDQQTDLKDMKKIQKLNSFFLDLLIAVVTDNHADSCSRVLIDIFHLVPLLSEINRLQREVIASFSVAGPPKSGDCPDTPATEEDRMRNEMDRVHDPV